MSVSSPVFEVLGLHLGHLAAGEVKHLLAEQLEDDHVVLAEALAGPAGTHDVTDEGGPVLGPFLLQDLQQTSVTLLSFQLKKPNAAFSHLYEDHVEFGDINTLLLWRKVRRVTSAGWKCQHKPLLTSGNFTSMFAGSEEVLMIKPTTYFLIPTEESLESSTFPTEDG